MKKIYIAAIAIFLVNISLQAQVSKGNDSTAYHKGMHRNKGMSSLHLTADQKNSIKQIHDSYRQQFADLNSNKTAADYASKTAALRKEQHEKIQALLTPEQKSQLIAQRKNRMQKMQAQQTNRLNEMKTRLGLSDEQSAKIQQSQAALHDKIKSIRSDQTLTDTQKREQVKAVARQQRKELKSILTPEQLEKMKTDHKVKRLDS